MYRFSCLSTSKFDPSVFEIDSFGKCTFTALPLEKINIFFAYYTLESDLSKCGSSTTIDIKISSVSFANIVSVVKLDIYLQSYIVHRSMHLYQPEKSTLKKSLLFMPMNSKLSRKKYVHCIDLGGGNFHEPTSRGFVDWKIEESCVLIELMYKCSSFPQNGQILIFIYDDQFRLKLCEVCKIHQHLSRMPINPFMSGLACGRKYVSTHR
jgi:hypothetical protein